jgi:membrane protein DedA with SNARE-associated domain
VPEALSDLTPYLQHYGLWAVFGALMLESLGLPLPGETLLVAGAALASQGELDLVALLVTAWSAAVLGDNLGYAIGRFGGRQLILRHGRHVGLSASRFARVEAFFRRFGAWVVFGARFFALLRQLNGPVAGAVGMGWWRFLACNALGAAAWVAAWGLGVFFLGHELHRLVPGIHRVGYLAAALAAAALLLLALGWLGATRPAPTEASAREPRDGPS